MTWTVRVPGKAMLAGEYCVLEPGGLAVAMAVARHLHVRAHEAVGSGGIELALGADKDPGFATAASVRAATALAAEGLKLRALRLELTSAFGTVEGTKLGLGGSAATVAGVVAAILAAHGADMTNSSTREEVETLARAAHAQQQGRAGSGYDVTTVVRGGCLAIRPAGSGHAPLSLPAVRALALPTGLAWGVVGTGVPASTPALIERAAGCDTTPLRSAAESVAAALESGCGEDFLAALAGAQAAFESWDAAHGLGLMTPELTALASQARQSGLVPRVSGAGGGDSLLVFGADPEALTAGLVRWSRAGWWTWEGSADTAGITLLP